MDRTSKLEYLTFLILCSLILCLCKTCEPLGDAQICILKTSQSGEWFSGLDSKLHKVQILLVFDSLIDPQYIPLETFNLGILVVNVSIENAKVCDEGAALNFEQGPCLNNKNVIETINKVLGLFQNRVIFVSLHLKTNTTLRYTPLSGIKMLTDMVTSGFKVKFLEPLARTSSDLVSVTLENAGITGLNEIDFKGSKYLEVLKLNYNKLKDLSPSQLPIELKKLKTLELQYNEITRIDRDNFLKNMKKLVALHLQGNRITFVDEFAFGGLENLIYLSLGNNGLVVVPAVNSLDGSHSNLEELILRQNNITVLDREAFRNVPRLLYLDLRFTCIGAFDLSNLENLKSLKLSNSCTKTFKFKQGKSSLKSLHVDGNRFETFDENFVSILNGSDLEFEADFSNNPWSDCDAFVEWHDASRCKNEIGDLYKCKVGDRNLTVKFINSKSFKCIERFVKDEGKEEGKGKEEDKSKDEGKEEGKGKEEDKSKEEGKDKGEDEDKYKVPAVSKAATLHFVCLSFSACFHPFVKSVCLGSVFLRFLE